MIGSIVVHHLRQVKREPVDLVTEDYDVSLCQRVGNLMILSQYLSQYNKVLTEYGVWVLITFTCYTYLPKDFLVLLLTVQILIIITSNFNKITL